MATFFLKSSSELAAALEAVRGGYSIANLKGGVIRFVCSENETEAIIEALRRITPIYALS